MTTVTEAMNALLARCDGARSKDGQGFNGRDAEFAHSLGHAVEKYGGLTPNQERAMHRVLRTYTKQLANMGIVYKEIIVEIDVREAQNGGRKEMNVSVAHTRYGLKIFLKFDYDRNMKSLN